MKKTAIAIILFIVVATTILSGLAGTSTIWLTIVMYSLAWYILTKITGLAFKNAETKTNVKLLITSFLATAFAAELTLKYILKKNLSYSELNGSGQYISPYTKIPFQFGQSGPFVLTHEANSSKPSNKPEFNYPHNYNSLGLRGAEPQSDTGLFTLIGLGDSFTEGIGAPQDSAWPVALKKELNQKYPDLRCQTINAGISGSDPFFELGLLKQRLLQFKPAVVILAINQSDIDDVLTRGGEERFANTGLFSTNGPKWEFFYAFSYIVRAIATNIFNYNQMLLTPQQYSLANKQSTEKIKHCIFSDFKSLAAKYHFKLVVVMHPMQQELETQNFALQQMAADFSADTSFQTINLFNSYTNWHKATGQAYSSIYWDIDRHHNSAGYQLWASTLANEIKL